MIDEHACPDPPGVDTVLRTFRGQRAFDVGGNVGWAARIFAARFETVYSFEPCAESFEVLARSVPSNVFAQPWALTRHAGPLELVEFAGHLAQGQLATEPVDAWLDKAVGDGGWGAQVGTRVVDGRTLDDAAWLFGPPDFIKCDVEGHEVEVFAGAAETLYEHRPALYIEVHGPQLGAELEAQLRPLYGPSLVRVRHPNYPAQSVEWHTHWWWVAQRP